MLPTPVDQPESLHMPWRLPSRLDGVAERVFEADRLESARSKDRPGAEVSATYEWQRVKRGDIDAATAVRLILGREEGEQKRKRQLALEEKIRLG